jgi:hypothetical protein
VIVFDALQFHGDIPGAEAKTTFREVGGIHHILAHDDRMDAELCIDILLNLLGISPSFYASANPEFQAPATPGNGP